jgi:DNA-binding MurR/RpiR family transcriptional regulator
MADTLALIRESIESLRNSEKKVAKCVLGDPSAVSRNK